jgi:type IV secretion system protein TrbL
MFSCRRWSPPECAAIGVILIVLGVASSDVAAAQSPSQALDNIAASYQHGASIWLGRLSGIAQQLFITLGSLEVAVSSLLWVLRRENLDEIAGRVLLKFIALSFMLTLITAFGYWMPRIVDSFEAAGSHAIGGPTISPSSIIDVGVQLSGTVLRAVNWVGAVQSPTVLVTGLFAAAAALLIEVAYVVIAAMVLLTWIEGFIALGGGVLFLGFAASRWSAAYAENFINYIVNIGIRIFVLYLVVGIGMSVTNDMLPIIETAITASSDLTPLGQVLGMALLIAIVAVRVPLAVAGRVTAQHSFGLAQALRSL